MLSFDTVHALTDCFIHVQRETPPALGEALAHLGTIVLVQDRPTGSTGRRSRLRILAVPLLVGRHHHHTLPAALDQFADTLALDKPHGDEHGDTTGTARTSSTQDNLLFPEILAVLRHALDDPRPGCGRSPGESATTTCSPTPTNSPRCGASRPSTSMAASTSSADGPARPVRSCCSTTGPTRPTCPPPTRR